MLTKMSTSKESLQTLAHQTKINGYQQLHYFEGESNCFIIINLVAEGSDSSYSDCKKERPHGVKDVQGSLTQAIADTDRNSGIKLTVCLHFAPT